MAAGKWVLHKSFLEDSRQVGHFVDEEPHEWGTEVPGEQPNKLAKAAKRWRVKLETQRKVNKQKSFYLKITVFENTSVHTHKNAAFF